MKKLFIATALLVSSFVMSQATTQTSICGCTQCACETVCVCAETCDACDCK